MVFQLTGIANHLGALDWNGSGMHANFSNSLLRTAGSKAIFDKVCEAFRPVIKEHIAVYGADNHLRLTGKHETAALMISAMVFLTVVLLSVFRLVFLQMDGKVIWKIVVQTLRPILTK